MNTLVGDATKANQKLGWEPKVSLEELVADMIKYDTDTDTLLKEKDRPFFS